MQTELSAANTKAVIAFERLAPEVRPATICRPATRPSLSAARVLKTAVTLCECDDVPRRNVADVSQRHRYIVAKKGLVGEFSLFETSTAFACANTLFKSTDTMTMIVAKSCARSSAVKQGVRRLSTADATAASYAQRFQQVSPGKFAPLTTNPSELMAIRAAYRFKAASPGGNFPIVPKEAAAYRAFITRKAAASPLIRSQVSAATKVASDAAFAARFSKASPGGFAPLEPAARIVKFTSSTAASAAPAAQSGGTSPALVGIGALLVGGGAGYFGKDAIDGAVGSASA